MEYNHQKIEPKWQKYWEKKNIFKADDKSKKQKFYCLDMFPYPSANGIHVGHLRGYTFSDVISKKKLMEGYSVLHPMGWDAFGLPAENFAIKTGVHPIESTKKAIEGIKKQLIYSGLGYDWDREICSYDPEYYKWTQWIFLKLYESGLSYKKEARVNFCPSCKTVLANEQVVNGSCERCDSEVEKKYLNQWFFKITNFVERLLSDLDNVDWPEKIKAMQRNWIGKSNGTNIYFKIVGLDNKIDVFTTRVDTLFGCTYVVVSPEHPILSELKDNIINQNEVEKYIKKAGKKTEIEKLAEDKEKTGVELKGIKAINPINNVEVPVFVGDYVLLEYGTGAIMAVPAHDQRDYIFAKEHNLPITEVIKAENGDSSIIDKSFEDEGVLVESEQFSGLNSLEAKKKMTEWLQKNKIGEGIVYYKLRDWLISRQRYWGVPIPIIYCDKCGEVPVPEKDLPVKLPNIKDFKPTGDGQSPLARSENFINVKCPKCGGKGKRETDTMDTFVCSSWYYIRYADPKNKKEFAEAKKINNWLPVDLYMGGAEHAVLHLLYARFFAKFLFDKKLIQFEEPFSKLFNQGTIYRNGSKMSKSRGNVVSPDDFINKYGADTMRLYELFIGPADQSTEWSDNGVAGCSRFLNKVWDLKDRVGECTQSEEINKLIHKTIKKVTEDIDEFRFNTAVSSLMILVNKMDKEKEIDRGNYKKLILLLAPMVPHISEEIWNKIEETNSVFSIKWPKYDKDLIKDSNVILIIQINGKIRDEIEVEIGLSKEEAEHLAISREKIKNWITGKDIKKVIFVPDKLINIVVYKQ
ncbi:MAG: leucine--tRNA ligase [Candidatus Nealsonbacteria bacterium]